MDMTRTTRLTGLLAVLLLSLTACGATDSGTETGTGTEASATASTPTQDTTAAASDGIRTVTDYAGRQIEVPASPSEVVGMHFPSTANLIALGLQPAAANEGITEDFDGLGKYLPEALDLASLPTYGNAYEPDFEAIANADPEMIVGNEVMKDIRSTLTEIAPTVLVARPSNGAWRQRFLDVAEAVGHDEEATEIEADYERFLDSLPNGLSDMTVAFIRPGEDNFRIDSVETGFSGSVLQDAGIPRLSLEGVGEVDGQSGYARVSSERLGTIENANLIVVPVGEIEKFRSNPLWKELPAVQEDNVIEVPYAIYNGGHHWAAKALLQALADAMETEQ